MTFRSSSQSDPFTEKVSDESGTNLSELYLSISEDQSLEADEINRRGRRLQEIAQIEFPEDAFPEPETPESIRQNWIGLAKSKLSQKTYGRILRLAIDAQNQGISPLKSGSLRTFLTFWEVVRDIAPEPDLTIARNGNIVAEWHKNWQRHLDIEFKEDGMVLYGLFIGKIVNEGRDVARVLAERLVESGPWSI